MWKSLNGMNRSERHSTDLGYWGTDLDQGGSGQTDWGPLCRMPDSPCWWGCCAETTAVSHRLPKPRTCPRWEKKKARESEYLPAFLMISSSLWARGASRRLFFHFCTEPGCPPESASSRRCSGRTRARIRWSTLHSSSTCCRVASRESGCTGKTWGRSLRSRCRQPAGKGRGRPPSGEGKRLRGLGRRCVYCRSAGELGGHLCFWSCAGRPCWRQKPLRWSTEVWGDGNSEVLLGCIEIKKYIFLYI